jgi:DNA-binding MarR family transcriptional regulator
MPEIDPFVASLQEAFGIFRRRLMRNLFVYAKDNGLTMPQFGAMFYILHSGGCGVSDIGNDLGVSNSAASQMLDRLVQTKLISRSEDPEDRRGKLLVLTDKGREILVKGNLTNQLWLEDIASSMTPEEQEQVRQAINILIDKARQLEPSSNKTIF